MDGAVGADVLFLVGRLLAAAMYLLMGVNHFVHLPEMIDYAESRSAPVPLLTVPVTGLALIGGALSIGLGVYPTVGVIIVVAFLLLGALLVHRPLPSDDARTGQQEMVNMLRNLALAGTTLALLANPDWPYSLMSQPAVSGEPAP